MYIKRNSYIRVICNDNSILEGKIHDIVLTKKENGEMDAAIMLTQTKKGLKNDFGSAVVPLSFVKKLYVN